MMDDLKNIGLSEKSNELLTDMVEKKVFDDALDGYRLATSLAIVGEMNPDDHEIINRMNKYDVGGVDPDGKFKKAISELMPEKKGIEYRCIEKLADMGIKKLSEHIDIRGELDFEELIKSDAT